LNKAGGGGARENHGPTARCNLRKAVSRLVVNTSVVLYIHIFKSSYLYIYIYIYIYVYLCMEVPRPDSTL